MVQQRKLIINLRKENNHKIAIYRGTLAPSTKAAVYRVHNNNYCVYTTGFRQLKVAVQVLMYPYYMVAMETFVS